MRSHKGFLRRRALWAVLAASTAVVPAAQAQEAGFGTKIPLKSAVKQIVPDGYSVSMGPGVDGDAPLTWNGGGWKDALTSSAKRAGYSVTISGETVKIAKAGGARVETSESAGEPQASASRGLRGDDGFVPVRPRQARAEAPRRERVARYERQERVVRHVPRHVPRRVRVVEAETVSGGGFVMLPVRDAGPREPVTKGAWREARADVRGEAPPPAPAGLVVRDGQNLREVLAEWTAQNGWRLVWESEFTYRLNTSARFGGDFIGATSDLLKSMRHIRPLITAQFYQANRTLVVGNNSSDAAGQ